MQPQHQIFISSNFHQLLNQPEKVFRNKSKTIEVNLYAPACEC